MGRPRVDLQSLPRFGESWSFVYVEKSNLERVDNGLLISDARATVSLPCSALSCLMLGPGTTVTAAAMELLASNGTSVVWTGEAGVRCYAAGLGETRRASNFLRQVEAWAEPLRHIEVVRRMYRVRFPEELPEGLTLEQIRGREGVRVRDAYANYSKMFGVTWTGRLYKPQHWASADPINRAISVANACLHGLCHAAIVSTGFSAALGFIHTGKALSFVYDIADLYKIDVTVPAAFEAVGRGAEHLERHVRIACRDRFRQTRLMEKILPDIQRVLGLKQDVARLYDLSEDAPAESRLWDPSGSVAGGQNHAPEEPQ